MQHRFGLTMIPWLRLRVGVLLSVFLFVSPLTVRGQVARVFRESFDDFDSTRFHTEIPNRNTTVRDGVLWTRGESGGKYPPMVSLDVEGTDLEICFRYRHLQNGGMVWFFIDGDDGFGGVDHMLRVKLLRTSIQVQIDSHSLDAKHPDRQNSKRPADKVSGAYRLNQRFPQEPVDLSANVWRAVKLTFQGDRVAISVDGNTWSKTLKHACFNAAKRKVLWMKNGGAEGIEIDDLLVREVVGDDCPIPTVLAKRGKLILDDDGSRDRGGRTVARFDDKMKLRAGAGAWERSATDSNVWRSTWQQETGHTPVASYQGFEANDLIVEVTFRYGEMTKPWHTQCFRIAADQRPQVAGHIVSAWANPNNDFIETGFLLQHIRKTSEKLIVEDLLMDRQLLSVEPNVWYTATLEIVGDEALFRMGDHVAYAKAEQIRMPRNLVSLTLGKTWHEIKRVRIWHAEQHPDWAMAKKDTLKSRQPFTAVVHSDKKK